LPFYYLWAENKYVPLAAKSASAMPLIYDMYFRKVLGEKYDEIERPIWTEGGKEVKNLNPEYTHRLNANMCSGGRYCEMIIERQLEPGL
jgi:hypothetical protein